MNLQLPRRFKDPFLLDDYLEALAPAEVVKAVHITAAISPQHIEAESHWIAAISNERGLPTAIVGTVDPENSASDIEALLDREMANPAYRGIRLLAGIDYESSAANTILSALAERKLIYDAVAHPGGGIAALTRAARKFGDLVIALEHTGWPLSDDAATFNQWRAEMTQFASLPNTNCKLSGLAMFIHHTDVDAFRRYFDVCIELFGTNRCMFGSNFPVDLAYGEFPDLFNVFQQVAQSCGEQGADDLFERTAERVYRI